MFIGKALKQRGQAFQTFTLSKNGFRQTNAGNTEMIK
jgi:hypothetical protein